MKQYVNFSYKAQNNSFKNSFLLVFNKIETLLFSFLCVVFLIISKNNDGFQEGVSDFFVNVSAPFVKAVEFPINFSVNLLTNFSELSAAKTENAALKEELENLKIFYIKALDVSAENRELRQALNFVAAKSSNFKVAKIIGRTSQLFSQKVFVDAGSNRQIAKGQIVTTIKGVVGRVDEVFEDHSRLILINDGASRIPVIASDARVRGILAGDGSDVMEILYLPKNHQIKVGDAIFTSGDGDTLPPGLFVGKVVRVDEESAFVAMAQDLATADVVTIVE